MLGAFLMWGLQPDPLLNVNDPEFIWGLMEYRAEMNHQRLVEQCREHLEILALLEAGNKVDASHRMRQHLSGAVKRKSPIVLNWAADKGTVEALKKGT